MLTRRNLALVIATLLPLTYNACGKGVSFERITDNGAQTTGTPGNPDYEFPGGGNPPGGGPPGGGGGTPESAILSSLAMVADRVDCVMCHLTVYGDLGATADKPFALHNASRAKIYGNVFSNQRITRTVSDPDHVLLEDGGAVAVSVDKTLGLGFIVKDQGVNISYPSFKADKLKAAAQAGSGKISRNGAVQVDKVHNGNFVVDANSYDVAISGEIFIDGDLIIFGSRFSGAGTIYANGNIYIPNDILLPGNKALFQSYRDNVAGADNIAKTAITDRVSNLRLAARDFVIIGNPGKTNSATSVVLPPDTRLKNYFTKNFVSYYTGENKSVAFTRNDLIDGFLTAQTSSNVFATQTERLRVFDWYPEYVSLLKPEFELDQTVCSTGKKFRVEIGSVSQIDATLYGAKGIGGVISAGGNILINGGVITKSFSILTGTPWSIGAGPHNRAISNEVYITCPTGSPFVLGRAAVNPVNSKDVMTSIITYDYRLRNNGAGFNSMRMSGY